MMYLFTILDVTSRWIEAIPLAEATACNCCTALVYGWMQRVGLPQTIYWDNGNAFVANLWKDVQEHMGIEVKFTPPYHACLWVGWNAAIKTSKTV